MFNCQVETFVRVLAVSCIFPSFPSLFALSRFDSRFSSTEKQTHPYTPKSLPPPPDWHSYISRPSTYLRLRPTYHPFRNSIHAHMSSLQERMNETLRAASSIHPSQASRAFILSPPPSFPLTSTPPPFSFSFFFLSFPSSLFSLPHPLKKKDEDDNILRFNPKSFL